MPKPKKKKREEYKVCDFVDTLKMVEGDTSTEEETFKVPKSKAAREELDSVVPTEREPKKEPSRRRVK